MTAPITRAEIEQLRRLDREATQGEWRAGSVELDAVFVEATHADRMGPERVLLRINHHFDGYDRDAALIAAMRNALPRLLDAAEAQAHRLSWDEVERAAEEQDPGHLLRVNADLRKRLDEVRGERDRLRALLAEFKSALGPVPGWPESSTARDLRARVEAELGCGQAVVAHETPEGDGR